jgi:hypothetical protein
MALQISFDQYKKFLLNVDKVKSLYPDYSEEQLALMAKIKKNSGPGLMK